MAARLFEGFGCHVGSAHRIEVRIPACRRGMVIIQEVYGPDESGTRLELPRPAWKHVAETARADFNRRLLEVEMPPCS